MNIEATIRSETMLDLIAHINEDVALIEEALACARPATIAREIALARIKLRLRQLDVLATAIEIERAPQCQD